MTATIRQLAANDAEAFLRLRREALLDAPLAFSSSPRYDRVSSAEAARAIIEGATGSWVFGAFAPDPGGIHKELLVGMVGLRREDNPKLAHKGYIWGMYVSPEYRRQGIGQALLGAAIEHALGLEGVTWVQLSVSEAAPAARRLYERNGFVAWGTEPEALRHGGRTVSETHMALHLGWGEAK
jgi:RimJ/RimL family protein N-acetyltransferase